MDERRKAIRRLTDQYEAELRMVTPEGECITEIVMLAHRLGLKGVEELEKLEKELG